MDTAAHKFLARNPVERRHYLNGITDRAKFVFTILGGSCDDAPGHVGDVAH